MAKSKFSEGQRWSFRPAVEHFESSFVIGAINDWDDKIEYSLYVQFTVAAREHLLPDTDGVTLVMNPAELKSNAHKLLESNVQLPWWWPYGRRIEEGGKKPNSQFPHLCSDLQGYLPGLFDSAVQESRLERGKKAALDRSQLKKKGAKKKAAPKTIAEAWDRLAAWYAENAPGYSFFKPAKGATAKEIAATEKTLGVKLPEDFKESVRIHNGGECWIQPYYGELLSLKQIVEQWKMYRKWQKETGYADPESDEWQANKLRGPAKRIFWNTKRIYVSDNSGGHLTLDLDPPREGEYGQVIAHDHEVGPTKVVASSWTEFLTALVKDHESGKYVYVPEEDSVRLVKELKG